MVPKHNKNPTNSVLSSKRDANQTNFNYKNVEHFRIHISEMKKLRKMFQKNFGENSNFDIISCQKGPKDDIQGKLSARALYWEVSEHILMSKHKILIQVEVKIIFIPKKFFLKSFKKCHFRPNFAHFCSFLRFFGDFPEFRPVKVFIFLLKRST